MCIMINILVKFNIVICCHDILYKFIYFVYVMTSYSKEYGLCACSLKDGRSGMTSFLDIHCRYDMNVMQTVY